MFCPKCGKEATESDMFCAYCGVKLARENPAAITGRSALSRYYALEAEIGDIKDEQASLPAKESYLNRLTNTKNVKWNELQHVRQIMQKEKKDYDELLKTSFASIKAKLSGDIDQKKKKEETEYLEALANFRDVEQEYRQLDEEVKSLTSEIEGIKGRVNGIPKIEEEMHQLLAQLTAGKSSEKLIEMESQYNRVRASLAEIQSITSEFKQADSLLGAAESNLMQAKNALGSAKGLGTWDTFFGGGFFADSIKHNKLDNARHSITQAQSYVRRAKDLIDGLDDIHVDFEAPSFFTDVFFDNFFFDLVGNSKVSRTYDRVNNALYKLSDNRRNVKRYVDDYERQRLELVRQLNDIRKQIDKERIILLD
ncbi:MAG: zinc-ribbon domain-containing protein [Candidatus Odinarchaeota archaeon]